MAAGQSERGWGYAGGWPWGLGVGWEHLCRVGAPLQGGVPAARLLLDALHGAHTTGGDLVAMRNVWLCPAPHTRFVIKVNVEFPCKVMVVSSQLHIFGWVAAFLGQLICFREAF